MKWVVLFLFVVINLFETKVVEANGLSGMSVTPTRIILGDQKRSAAITLINTSDTVASYRIKFVEMGLGDDGGFVVLSLDDQPDGFNALSPYARFSPRQVRLSAGASQVIRVMVRRGQGLPDTEYRSHLEVRVIPDVSNNDFLKEVVPGKVKKAVPIVVTRLGVTLPVIWRKGNPVATASIDHVVFKKQSDGLIRSVSFDVLRSGERSVFGDLSIFTKDKSGKKRNLSLSNSHGMYHPYKSENIILPVHSISEEELNSSEGVWVEYVNEEYSLGSKIIFEEKIEWNIQRMH